MRVFSDREPEWGQWLEWDVDPMPRLIISPLTFAQVLWPMLQMDHPRPEPIDEPFPHYALLGPLPGQELWERLPPLPPREGWT